MSAPAIAAVITGATLVAGVVFVVLAVHECSREIDGVIAALPDPHDELDELAAEDEHLDRLLFSRRPPIDPQEAELWARQMTDPDSDDRIHAEAEQ
jgi:hypothetical protein